MPTGSGAGARVTARAWGALCVALVLASGAILAAQAGRGQGQSASARALSPDELRGLRYGAAPLRQQASDPRYGYSDARPVDVGGGLDAGIANTYRFLNALRGPKGEIVHYRRVGSCCSQDRKGPLDQYEISYDGGEPKTLYINWYDESALLVPVGLTARK